MTARKSVDRISSQLRVPWAKSERGVPRLIIRPLQQFLRTEASSGILLLLAAIAALIWANAAASSYERVWHTQLTVGLGRWAITEDVRHWINDGAMAVFFFVVGLEIKRELVSGELRDTRAAVLPVVAAIGGMLVPALVYLAITAGTEGTRGWGIPMATDIAFALGVLALAGRRLPSGLRLFLLTLAIVDDIGAILVIALFYSGSISFASLGVGIALLCVMVLLRRVQVRAGGVFLFLGIGVWLAVYESGIHATIAGVGLAIVTPAVAFQRPRAVSEEARRVADKTSDTPNPADVDAPEWLHLAGLSREAVSPLVRLEHTLHPWSSFLIVPVFALANAGVRLAGGHIGDAASVRVGVGVAAGLILGKVVGITLGTFAATRSRLARLPAGVAWSHIVGTAALGGIGFTVSLFMANLAFGENTLLDGAKIGIFAASVISGLGGSMLLSRTGHRPERRS